jgi:predicted nuclease of predicted toxin-antitoxin system
MKLLFDQNISHRLCVKLRDIFPDSSQVRLLGLDRMNDNEIWQYARQQGFIVVTQDADFYDLSLLYGAPPKILWLRCGNQPTAFIEQLLRSYTSEIYDFANDPTLSCLELYY